jgi:AraC-like DNA-binding protein
MPEPVDYMPVPAVLRCGNDVIPPDYGEGSAYRVPDSELTWIRQGQVTATVGDESFDLGAGGCVLIPAGESIRYAYPRGATRHPVQHAYVVFRLPAGTELAGPPVRRPQHDDLLPTLLDHVLWLDATRPVGWQQSIELAFGYALRVFTTGDGGRLLDSGSTERDPVRQALALLRPWVTNGVMPTPTLDDMAAAAGVSPKHLCSVFAAEVGVTPVRTIRLIRLARAAELLRRTRLPIAEIGWRTGFASEFHFSRTFKQHASCAPSAFRSDPAWVFELPGTIHRLNRLLDGVIAPPAGTPVGTPPVPVGDRPIPSS